MSERWSRDYVEPEDKVYMTEGEIEAFVARLERGPICASIGIETTSGGACCTDTGGTVQINECT